MYKRRWRSFRKCILNPLRLFAVKLAILDFKYIDCTRSQEAPLGSDLKLEASGLLISVAHVTCTPVQMNLHHDMYCITNTHTTGFNHPQGKRNLVKDLYFTKGSI